jgi:hypothetical protein
MILLLLIFFLVFAGAWFAWVYGVTPAKDLERITASYAGTDASVLKIQRLGVQIDRSPLTWTADKPSGGSGTWYRMYLVTLAKPGGTEDQTLGVEVKVFGLPGLKRYSLGG